MMAELIDRKRIKRETRELLSGAQVSPKGMTALYLLLSAALAVVDGIGGGAGLLSTFLNVLTTLVSSVLAAGFALYCMAVRRGTRAEYLTLFDGFSFAGKVIALTILEFVFVSLWAMLFVIPGVIALYRYQFALYNLYENPSIGVMEALEMSKRQTQGYKSQLFMLDLSYLGWILLATLPSLYLAGRTVPLIMEMMARGVLYIDVDALVIQAMRPLSPALWTALSWTWHILVSLFYLPHQICAELGYFEIAQRTSGIGANAAPKLEDGGWNGL